MGRRTHGMTAQEMHERKEELESLKNDVKTAQEELDEATADLERIAQESDDADAISEAGEAVDDAQKELDRANEEFGADEQKELASLEDVENEVGDLRHAHLIHEDDFEDYAQDFAEEYCDMKSAAQWPFTCIDWEKAARDLRMDFSTIDHDGETYLYQS